MAIERSSATAGHFSEEQYSEILQPAERDRENDGPQGQRRIILVVEENSNIGGFLAGRVLDEEWEIENIVVADEWRRKSFGSTLVNEFLTRARQNGAANIYLEVRESNVAARSLYEKCKFAETGRRKNYYRNPDEDAILYSLRLK